MKDHHQDRRLAFDTSPGALYSGYRISAKPPVVIEPAIKALTYPACLGTQCRGTRRRCETPDECARAEARWFAPTKRANLAIGTTLAIAAVVLVVVVPDWSRLIKGKTPAAAPVAVTARHV